jgi:DNA primase catalytic subunit
MKRYQLPEGFRYSALGERKEFYEKEFDLKRLAEYMSFRDITQTVFSCIIGRHTGIYREKYKKISKSVVLFEDLSNLEELKKNLAEYLPEGVYYDRNVYVDKSKCAGCKRLSNCFKCKNFVGQELAFDLDPENVDCPIHGDLENKMRQRQGLSFCNYEFEVVRTKAIELYEYLSGFYSDIKIVYSGRGFHVLVMDKETLYLGYKERKALAEKIMKKNIPIDEWVTTGEVRLIRLPYSLHGMVSRICTPLDISELVRFNPKNDWKCTPRFISSSR